MAEEEALVNELRTRVERLELLLMIGRMMHATSDQEELITSIARGGRTLPGRRSLLDLFSRSIDRPSSTHT